jgi:3-isopropylmalate dehydrogenase
MMRSGSWLQIAVWPGDGIGVEVMDACLNVLEALSRHTALRFNWNQLPGGANAYRKTGSAFTDEVNRLARGKNLSDRKLPGSS